MGRPELVPCKRGRCPRGKLSGGSPEAGVHAPGGIRANLKAREHMQRVQVPVDHRMIADPNAQ